MAFSSCAGLMNCIWTEGESPLDNPFPELPTEAETPLDTAPNARAAVDRAKLLRENDEEPVFIIHCEVPTLPDLADPREVGR